MKEDEHIEKWIRASLRKETPPTDFTERVMKRIEDAELVEEKALASLLKKNVMASPSDDFTSKVMGQIAVAPERVRYPVIIGKKAWILIGSLMLIFIALVITSTKETGASPGVVEGLVNKLDGALSFQVPEILTNPMLAFSLLALSSLLFIDQLIGKRKLSYHF